MGRGVEYLPACFVFFSFQGGGGGNTDGGHGQRNQRSRFESGWRRRQGRRRRLPPSLLSTEPRCVSGARGTTELLQKGGSGTRNESKLSLHFSSCFNTNFAFQVGGNPRGVLLEKKRASVAIMLSAPRAIQTCLSRCGDATVTRRRRRSKRAWKAGGGVLGKKRVHEIE